MEMKTFVAGAMTLIVGLGLSTVSCSDDDDPTPSTNNNTTMNNNMSADAGVTTDDAGMADPDAGGGADAGVDPDVVACRATIAAKETQFAGQLNGWSIADATEMIRADGDQSLEADYAGRYRDDLDNHPGCQPRAMYGANTSEPLSFDNNAMVPAGMPANINGYACAAKEYTQPNEDTTKPIVILVHGNSSGVTTYEEYTRNDIAGTTFTNAGGFEFMVDAMAREQLASKLVAAGYRVIGFDARTDLVATLGDYSNDQATGNPFLNMDHGWVVPMLQSLIKAVMNENPERKVSIIAHSLGVTTTRDALRRLYNETGTGAVNPYGRLQDVVLLSGANHGVSSGAAFCPNGTPALPNMRATVTCEMGDRTVFVPTYFTQPLNGPGDTFSTPCADGDYAYGQRDQCEGNVVEWTTVTMEDIPDGSLQDEFISEASSRLDMPDCVDNELITLADFDTSAYFFSGLPGVFANHFGSARSEAGMTLILDKLAD